MESETLKEIKGEATEEKIIIKNYKWDIVWANVVLLSLIHLCALYGFLIRNELLISTIIYWKAITIFSAYGITAGAHRLWSHKTYKANYIVQIFLMICMSIIYQNSIYIWCRDHRLHHKYSETDADPHNAKRGFFFSHVGWLMIRKHEDVKEKGKGIDMDDLKRNPIVMFQHRYYYPIILITSFVTTSLIPCYFFGENLKNAFFVATMYRYVVTYHVTWGINSFAHLYGYKPYNKSIGPTENTLMCILSFGEGFHNYHHTFPWDYRAAEFSNDATNTTTYLIDLFAKFGWVTNRRTVAQNMINARIVKDGDVKVKKLSNNLRDILLVAFYIYII